MTQQPPPGIILSNDDIAALLVRAHQKLDAATALLNELNEHCRRTEATHRKITPSTDFARALEMTRQLLEEAGEEISNAEKGSCS
jgi:uncharacterized protein YbaP (TraB family)